MPIFENVTVKNAQQVWASPDGQRKIHEVSMDVDGSEVKAKTYSDQIATVGWTGTVETYEKTGRNGAETFVKQPPKENGFTTQQGTHSTNTPGQGSSRSSFQSDPFTMYLSYAKDIVVATIEKAAKPIDFTKAIQLALGGAYELYNGRPEAKGTEQNTQVSPDKTLDEVLTFEELAKIDDILGKEGE